MRFFRLLWGIRFVVTKKQFWHLIEKLLKENAFNAQVRVSYAQCGEDLVLQTLLGNKRDGFYVDIGAHDPNQISVTKAFYEIGWKGVNIDANPRKMDLLKEFRTRDFNLNYACGQKPEYEFYVMSSSAMSTAETEQATKLVQEGSVEIREIVRIPGITLHEVLQQYCNQEVDLLNVDTEGMDLEVLRSAKFESIAHAKWPAWICLENALPLSKTLKLESVTYLLSLNFEIYCVLPHSLILRRPQNCGL